MIGKPQRDLGNLRREFLYFYAIALIDVDLHRAKYVGDVSKDLRRTQHVQFQPPQLAISDDEEVAAAAGWVEKSASFELRVG